MRFCCRRPEKRARVAAASPRIADDCEEAVELRENREEWMDALQGRLKTCCCAITGCLEFRRRYRDGAVTLRYSLANYPEERLRRHLVCLGHSAQGIDGIVERVKQNKDVRVALWHYFTDDREGTTLIAVTTDQRALQTAAKTGHYTPHPSRALGTVGDQLGAMESPS